MYELFISVPQYYTFNLMFFCLLIENYKIGQENAIITYIIVHIFYIIFAPLRFMISIFLRFKHLSLTISQKKKKILLYSLSVQTKHLKYPFDLAGTCAKPITYVSGKGPNTD